MAGAENPAGRKHQRARLGALKLRRSIGLALRAALPERLDLRLRSVGQAEQKDFDRTQGATQRSGLHPNAVARRRFGTGSSDATYYTLL